MAAPAAAQNAAEPSMVTVTIKNGVVTLQGIVFDDWDVRTGVRIAKKIPGVKRVVTDFYVPDGT